MHPVAPKLQGWAGATSAHPAVLQDPARLLALVYTAKIKSSEEQLHTLRKLRPLLLWGLHLPASTFWGNLPSLLCGWWSWKAGKDKGNQVEKTTNTRLANGLPLDHSNQGVCQFLEKAKFIPFRMLAPSKAIVLAPTWLPSNFALIPPMWRINNCCHIKDPYPCQELISPVPSELSPLHIRGDWLHEPKLWSAPAIVRIKPRLPRGLEHT